MIKLAQLFAFSALLATSATAEDTLRDRLVAIERFGVQMHDGTLAVTLHAYTAEQYEANAAELRQYEIDRSKHDLETEEYRRRQREVQERLRVDRSREVIEQMNNLQFERPKAPSVSSKDPRYGYTQPAGRDAPGCESAGQVLCQPVSLSEKGQTPFRIAAWHACPLRVIETLVTSIKLQGLTFWTF